MKSFGSVASVRFYFCRCWCSGLWQNAGTGAIAGVVTDSSGAVINQATVKVTNNLTGETRTAVSSGRGGLHCAPVAAGYLHGGATKAGFKNTSYRAITVSVDGDLDFEHSAAGGQRSRKPSK